MRPTSTEDEAGPLWKRLAWFFGLAVAGAGVTAAVAYALKALLPTP
jgi:hypothetical protein